MNDFSSDPNCVALWSLDDSALTVDSIGTNTLSNTGVASETSDYKEGNGSADYADLTDRLTITDSNLDADFPLKDGGSYKDISICFWFKVSAFPASVDRHILYKSSGDPNRSFYIACLKDTDWTLNFAISNDGTGWDETIDHGYALLASRWYHVGVTHKNSDKSYRIRIWDDTAGALLGEVTGNTSGTIDVNTGDFVIGHVSDALGGFKDEVVVFNDILTSDEIDDIRSGTYRAATTTT